MAATFPTKEVCTKPGMVHDRAQVQLAFAGGVFGDVGEPLLVRRGRREVVGDTALLVEHRQQVVVDRRPRLAALALLPGMGGEDPRGRAQSPPTVLRCDDANVGELVGEEPVAERGVVLVDIEDGVDEVGVVPVPL
jgi:hypothetical protein